MSVTPDLSRLASTLAEKWQANYANVMIQTPVEPCWVLRQHAHLLPLTGRALDLACGLGGNARFLAACGLKTQAWDISSNAIRILQQWSRLHRYSIESREVFIEADGLMRHSFDVIVVSRFLDRALFPNLANALKPNGLLFYQTFLAPVQANAPRNPAFYIQPTEYNQAWSNALNCEVAGEGWLADTLGGQATRQAWYVGRKPRT